VPYACGSGAAYLAALGPHKVIYEYPKRDSGYFPEALSVLTNIHDSCLFHEEHNLSHPGDLFLLTFNDVIECAHRLAKITNIEAKRYSTTQSEGLSDIDSIRIEIFNLLFYSSNFIESCQSIIKSLFKDGAKDKNFVRASREFLDNTKAYREHTSKIINLIKHQHRRVRPFTFSWDSHLIIGYFIEGLLAPTVLGPDPQVHKPFNKLNTGISINKDIAYHVINAYYASACLTSVIKKYAKITNDATRKIPGNHIAECLLELSNIPLLFLPDEFTKEIPVISKYKGDKFVLEIPSKKKPINEKPHSASVAVNAKMGIANRSFAPPYMPLNA
jgi:hypothetical protein